MWIELLSAVGDKKAGEFLDAAEPTARAYVTAGLAKDAGDGPDKIILERSLTAFRTELSTMTRKVAEDIQGVATEMKTRKFSIVPGEQQDDRTRGIGDFFRNVLIATDGKADAEVRDKAHERLTKVYATQRGQAEGQGATGGYLTPAVYETMLLSEQAEDSVFTPYARVIPLAARTTYWPALDQYSAPTAGNSAIFGGVTVSRKGENTARTQTSAKFKNVALNAKDMTAFTKISRDLIYDSTVPIDGLVTTLMGGAINWTEEWECFNGTGGGKFLGIYNAPSTILVSRNTGSTIKAVDVFTMLSRLLPSSHKNARWLAHPYTMPYLQQLVDPAGHYIMLPYPVAGERAALGESPVFQLLGIPVLFTEKAGVPGSTNDLVLTDRSKYLVGRRGGVEVGTSTEFAFDTDEIAIRAKLRNDGAPQLIKPIYLADGSNQVSSTVVLN